MYAELTSASALLAPVIAGALEAEGIPTRLERPSLGTVYGLDTGEWATRVLVPAEDLERARTVLREAERNEAW